MESADEEDFKICPHCAEKIKSAAIKCKHCKSSLTGASQAKEALTPSVAMPRRSDVSVVGSGRSNGDMMKMGCAALFALTAFSVCFGGPSRSRNSRASQPQSTASESTASSTTASAQTERTYRTEREQLILMSVDDMTSAQKLAKIHYYDDKEPRENAVFRFTQALNYIDSHSFHSKDSKASTPDVLVYAYGELKKEFPNTSLVYVAEDIAKLLPANSDSLQIEEVIVLYMQAVRTDGGQVPR